MKGRGYNRAAADMSFLLLLGFVLMVAMMLPFLNLPTKDMEREARKPQGQMSVELYWADPDSAQWNSNISPDVDLWVKAPGDIPVGYSNKGGLIFNLLRDDLGDTAVDLSKRNQEIAYARGLPDGEYIVNAQLYNLKQGTLPVSVRCVVTTMRQQGTALVSKQILVTDQDLIYPSQELTLFRFRLQEGELVQGSVNNIPQKLRGFRGGE